MKLSIITSLLLEFHELGSPEEIDQSQIEGFWAYPLQMDNIYV